MNTLKHVIVITLGGIATLLVFWPSPPFIRFMMTVTVACLCTSIVYIGSSRYGLISLISLLIGISHSTWHLNERSIVMSVMWVFLLGWLLDRTLEWRSKRGWPIACTMSKNRQKQVDNALLGKYDVAHSIGFLINALDFYWDKNAQEAAKALLIYHLPRLQASDAYSLRDYQRNRLRQALMEYENINLITAILEAFQRWGDSRDLACVEQFANSRKPLVANKDVQIALQSTLSQLRERVEQERQTQLLLRPIHQYDDPANTLVRPANGPSEAPAHSLLRPSEPDEDEKSSR